MGRYKWLLECAPVLTLGLVIFCALLLHGCATDPTTDSYCKIAKIIYVSPDDKFSDATARAILSNNKTYAAVCGKPKK